ncbi:serine hydroxymethyltransferase [Patescibacteria group bacterium]|nr:serine hydroxymethyltransferase [Patescibacteria group bacterium]
MTHLPNLQKNDVEIHDLIIKEEERQRKSIRLIPSENYVSKAVLEATGSVLTNKYSEGYAHKRYYEGQINIDKIEELAVSRAKELFGCEHANVQPYSGSPANMAAYFALSDIGDNIMGLSLPHGGHLTHGWKVNFSGRLYHSYQYTVDAETGLINYDKVHEMAKEHKPKIIFAGATAYPREYNFEKFGEIAKDVGAYFVADIAHINGLIVAGVHPDPVPFADVVTSTSHKAIRGPRGGFILCKEEHAKAIDRAVFPTLQGGPHNHTTAAIAVCFKEAMTEEFKEYARQVVKNAKKLADELNKRGYKLVTGGTDNHLVLIDMIGSKDMPGKIAAKALDKAGIVTNYNTIPWDKRKPFDPSGVRTGTPAITSRGMKEDEMVKIADWMDQVLCNPEDENLQKNIKKQVEDLCDNFPAPGLD